MATCFLFFLLLKVSSQLNVHYQKKAQLFSLLLNLQITYKKKGQTGTL